MEHSTVIIVYYVMIQNRGVHWRMRGSATPQIFSLSPHLPHITKALQNSIAKLKDSPLGRQIGLEKLGLCTLPFTFFIFTPDQTPSKGSAIQQGRFTVRNSASLHLVFCWLLVLECEETLKHYT